MRHGNGVDAEVATAFVIASLVGLGAIPEGAVVRTDAMPVRTRSAASSIVMVIRSPRRRTRRGAFRVP